MKIKSLGAAKIMKIEWIGLYAFENSRRDLHNALLCTALQSQFFVKNLPKFLLNFGARGVPEGTQVAAPGLRETQRVSVCLSRGSGW